MHKTEPVLGISSVMGGPVTWAGPGERVSCIAGAQVRDTLQQLLN